jgi:hypothetical protein
MIELALMMMSSSAWAGSRTGWSLGEFESSRYKVMFVTNLMNAYEISRRRIDIRRSFES